MATSGRGPAGGGVLSIPVTSILSWRVASLNFSGNFDSDEESPPGEVANSINLALPTAMLAGLIIVAITTLKVVAGDGDPTTAPGNTIATEANMAISQAAANPKIAAGCAGLGAKEDSPAANADILKMKVNPGAVNADGSGCIPVILWAYQFALLNAQGVIISGIFSNSCFHIDNGSTGITGCL